MLARDGFQCFPPEARVLRWVKEAFRSGLELSRDPDCRAQNLRHGNTWFVGVDVLPNTVDGSLNGVPLDGTWRDVVPGLPLHRAQLSIIYAGYPRRDPGQSASNHAFRVKRAAAHVDGLLPIGPDRRRFLREPHAYILGLPLNDVVAAPTCVWRGSHKIMTRAFEQAAACQSISDVDLTDIYADARRAVFEQCDPVPMIVKPGGAFVIHRHALHGTDPWPTGVADPTGQGRMIAFFRPDLSSVDAWLTEP